MKFPPGRSLETMLEARVLAWLMKGATHPCLPELIALDPLRARRGKHIAADYDCQGFDTTSGAAD